MTDIENKTAAALGSMDNLLAVVEDGTGVSLMYPDGNIARIELRETGDGAQIVIVGDEAIVLASGAAPQMQAAYASLLRQVKARSAAPGQRRKHLLFGGLAAAVVAGVALGGMLPGLFGGSAPSGRDQQRMIVFNPPSAEEPAAAPASAPAPKGASEAADRGRQLLRAALEASSNPGAAGIMKTEAKGAAAPEPKAAEAGAAPAKQEAQKAAEPQKQPGADSAAGQPAPASPAEAAAKLGLDPSKLDLASAQKLLGALEGLKIAAQRGLPITDEMLTQLPPEMAAQLRESIKTGDPAKQQAGAPAAPKAEAPTPAPQAAPQKVAVAEVDTRNAPRDPWGISSVPRADTWSKTNGVIMLPLPGGGDVQKPEDMLKFGLDLNKGTD